TTEGYRRRALPLCSGQVAQNSAHGEVARAADHARNFRVVRTTGKAELAGLVGVDHDDVSGLNGVAGRESLGDVGAEDLKDLDLGRAVAIDLEHLLVGG